MAYLGLLNKGDLVTSQGGTNVTLPVGTNSNILTANNSATDGIKWAAAPGSTFDYFSAYLSAPTGNVTGSGQNYPIVFNTTISNTGNYSTATGRYTAPVTGQYQFNTTVAFNGGDALTTGYLILWNGSVFSTRGTQLFVSQPGAETLILSDTIIIPMTAGDTIQVNVLVTGTNESVQIFGANPLGGGGSYAVASVFSGNLLYP